MKKTSISILIIILTLLTSCSSSYFLKERETEFGTKGQKKWIFHRLSDRDKGTTLAFPGYIIGIEKAHRKRIGAPSRQSIHKQNGLEKFDFNQDNTWESMPKRKRKVLDDKKAMFISSIHKFHHQDNSINRIDVATIYDSYDSTYLNKSTDAFNQSFDELNDFQTELKKNISKNKITHVFLFSMGWNSDQQEAIRNFNSMFLKIIDNANKSEKEFRPLFIGITWPSKWNDGLSNVFSFFNKTNDADEVGMTWANYLLNKIILPEKNINRFKTIVVGHSFGAKLTSRATMSASMLKEEDTPIDLLINLQSAYSINRYSSTKGIEPTSDYVNWKKYANNIALICSENDKAVKAGFYAPFAGGIKSYNKVEKDKKGNYKGIDRIKYSVNPLTEFKPENQLLLIDASEVIKREAYKKGGGAHSDIYNEDVAELIWNLISSKTY
jgi:predicted alpha/beta hydrolase family esterase